MVSRGPIIGTMLDSSVRTETRHTWDTLAIKDLYDPLHRKFRVAIMLRPHAARMTAGANTVNAAGATGHKSVLGCACQSHPRSLTCMQVTLLPPQRPRLSMTLPTRLNGARDHIAYRPLIGRCFASTIIVALTWFPPSQIW